MLSYPVAWTCFYSTAGHKLEGLPAPSDWVCWAKMVALTLWEVIDELYWACLLMMRFGAISLYSVCKILLCWSCVLELCYLLFVLCVISTPAKHWYCWNCAISTYYLFSRWCSESLWQLYFWYSCCWTICSHCLLQHKQGFCAKVGMDYLALYHACQILSFPIVTKSNCLYVFEKSNFGY